MRISYRAKYVLAAPLFVVATVAAQFATAIPTYAAPITWTGAGDGVSFSDGDNWSSSSAPVNGDQLTFTVNGSETEQAVLDNDIAGLSVSGINFTGSTSAYYSYTLTGDPITVTGAINNAVTGSSSDTFTPNIENNLVLGANTTVTKVNIGTTGSTLNTAGYTLTYSGAAGCGLNLNSNLSGSGALNITADGVNVRGDSAGYTGAIGVTGYALFAPTAFGATSAGTTVSGDGQLLVVHYENASIGEPLTLGGTGWFGSSQNYFGCSGGSGPAVNLTATGGVTLTSNFEYNGYNNFVVNEPFTAGGYTFAVASGANGTLTLPTGQVEAPTETIQLDGDDTDFVSIGNKQTGILNGTRESISVENGGTIKGTGTATFLYVNEGGVVAPGNSPGSLTVLESFTLSGSYQAEVLNASTYDQLVVGENYTGGGNAVFLNSGAVLDLVLFDGWTINTGETYTIIDNRSSTAVQGTFTGLAEGAQVVVDGITFSISYVGGDGNDVVLTALNTGSDPSTPNTGVHRFIAANPVVVAVLGAVTAGLLLLVALRRKSNQ